MTLGRQFEIGAVLGTGKFGFVYEAWMRGPDGFRKRVALKVLHEREHHGSESNTRFRDEARVLGLLQHQSIVHVDGLAYLDGCCVLVMELVEGCTLTGVLGAEPVPARPALQLVKAVASALDAGWKATDADGKPLWFLHRDIKPANIQLTPRGEVKLLDFGQAFARFEGRETETQAGVLLGTESYKPPERRVVYDREGETERVEDSPQGDVYSLGVVLFELLSGASRLPKSVYSETIHQQNMANALAKLSWLAEPVRALLREMLAYRPSDRPTPRAIEHRVEELDRKLEGPSLRVWAEERVPTVMSGLPRTMDGPLCGRTFLEEFPPELPDPDEITVSGLVPEMGTRQASAFSSQRASGRPLRVWALGSGALISVGVLMVGLLRNGEGSSPEQTAQAPADTYAPEERDTGLRQGAHEPPTDNLPPAPRRSTRPVPVKTREPPGPGTVAVLGDAIEVILVSAGGAFPPGPVPPGDYEVRARFKNTTSVPVTYIKVATGHTTRLVCSSAFAKCREE